MEYLNIKGKLKTVYFLKEFHSVQVKEIYAELKTTEKGLKKEEVVKRLIHYGENKIQLERKISPLELFINQFKNLPVILLILAAIVSIILGTVATDHESRDDSFIDALLIFTILIANAVFGFAQEYKAEKSIEALKKLSAPRATVMRNGEEQEIGATQIVPGDILILVEGDRIAADARVIESISLYVDESILTGESVPSEKKVDLVAVDAALGERKNMLYMSTSVTRGKGRAIVVSTALQTEVGKIAQEISETEEKTTPFQEEVEELGKKIASSVAIIIVVVAFTEFLFREAELAVIFITAVSLAVAAIPEGLPAVVTLALAIGTNKMLKQNALMRKLATVQNLGSLDVICTDKTGTLTENRMTVTQLFFDDANIEVDGKGHEITGKLRFREKEYPKEHLELLVRCGILCNDTKVYTENKELQFKGDPTEIAVLLPAYKANYAVNKIQQEHRRVGEIPFSSDRKMMTTVNEQDKIKTAYTKGAWEVIQERCTHIYENGKIRKILKKDIERITYENNGMAQKALRVLAFAYKEKVEKIIESEVEYGLVFLGLMGMIDPARTGVKEAIQDCRNAGIRVIMITGDNKLTAEAIGKELGFKGTGLTGTELEGLSELELKSVVEHVDIYARTSPKHKAMILSMLKANGHIVAMTGDGVNDAPALSKSDVGIAMGIRGTEVAKQASDMILLDDNFITIRNAIELGRGIFDNIRKFVVYLLGANLAEVLVVFLAAMLNLGLPLIAAHLLWINLLTDGLPALALGVDPPAKDIMKKKPRRKEDQIINKDALYMIITMGIIGGIVILGLFILNDPLHNLEKAQTVVFTSFVVFEMIKVYVVRAKYHTSETSNNWLHLAVASSIILQLIVLYTPLNTFFKTTPLDVTDWELIGGGIILYIISMFILQKIEKYIIPSIKKNENQSVQRE